MLCCIIMETFVEQYGITSIVAAYKDSNRSQVHNHYDQ